jgi:glycosyltransferase involved in cell wall biosynthesis
MSRSIFIYEPYATGHHTGFLRVLLTAFEERRDWRTTVLTSEEAKKHSAFKRLAEDFKDQLDVVVAPRLIEQRLIGRLVGTFYAEQFTNCRSLKQEFSALHAERRFNFALVPYIEALGIHNLAFRTFFGQVPWAIIPHGLRFHFRESKIKAPARRIDTLQRLCFLRMLRKPTLRAVFALDPYLVRWANHPKVRYVPVPSILPPPLDGQASRRSLGLPDDAVVVLAYGAIDGRKCLDILIPAVAQIDRSLKVLLVVAGVQDGRLRAGLLEGEVANHLRREMRLIEFDRFVSAEEEQMLFSAADIVWIYYREQLGSSGVLVRAGQFSKPVISSDVGLVARLVIDENCGLAVARPDPAAVAQAITELAMQPKARTEMGKRAFARFSQNVPDAFAAPITAAIQAA